MPVKSLYMIDARKARMISATEIEVEAPDFVVRLAFPNADARALKTVCKTINFATGMRPHAERPDNRDSGDTSWNQMS